MQPFAQHASLAGMGNTSSEIIAPIHVFIHVLKHNGMLISNGSCDNSGSLVPVYSQLYLMYLHKIPIKKTNRHTLLLI